MHPMFLPVALFFAFLLGLGSVPLVDLDEGAFGSATMEMLIRKDFITTYLGGELRFDKPILIYWLQALSVSVFGLNEWGLRLPSAIMAVLWATLVYLFCYREFSGSKKLGGHTFAKTAGLVAAVGMAASLYIVVVGRAAIADALLNFWLCCTMLAGFKFFSTGQKKYAYIGYMGMGFGLLTKGPIAVMIPVVVALLFTVVRFSLVRSQHTSQNNQTSPANHYWQRFWQLALNPVGWLITLAIALPWYVLEYMAQGQLFIDGFIFKHNLSRFDSAMEQHSGSMFYYVLLLPIILLPSTGLLLHTVKKLPTLLKTDLDCWLWIWFLFVLVFFSFSGTKLPHYVLYGCTPLFILMGKYHHELNDKPNSKNKGKNNNKNNSKNFATRSLVFLPLVLWLVVLLALPSVLAHIAPQQKPLAIQHMLLDAHLFLPNFYYVLVGFLLSLALYFWFANTPLVQSWLVFTVLHTLVLVLAVLPFIMNAKQAAVKQAGMIAKNSSETAVIDKITHRSFGIYRGKVTAKREPKVGELVFTDLDHKAKYLSKYPRSDVLLERSGVVLLKLTGSSPNLQNKPHSKPQNPTLEFK